MTHRNDLEGDEFYHYEVISSAGGGLIYWVHFRFGRFGDELLFGTQHVLNVHFGSRPKWTCKVQTQGLCFCDTRCVLVVRCPLNFGGSHPLIRCHLIMAAAVAEQEALKVQAWLTENGIESTADFAFWFTSFEEALQEAGRGGSKCLGNCKKKHRNLV